MVYIYLGIETAGGKSKTDNERPCLFWHQTSEDTDLVEVAGLTTWTIDYIVTVFVIVRQIFISIIGSALSFQCHTLVPYSLCLSNQNGNKWKLRGIYFRCQTKRGEPKFKGSGCRHEII